MVSSSAPGTRCSSLIGIISPTRQRRLFCSAVESGWSLAITSTFGNFSAQSNKSARRRLMLSAM